MPRQIVYEAFMANSALAQGNRTKISPMKWREWRDGWLFASPFLIGFVVWWLGPMLYSLFLVSQDWNLLSDPKYVGAENILNLFSDKLLRKSLTVTAYYTFVGVPLQLAVALTLALLLNNAIKFRAAFRTIFFLPAIVPAVAAALGWLQIFYPTGGLLNYYLGLDLRWLLDPRLAIPSLILMSLWNTGTQMIICLAGLQNIPDELQDAGQVDGANTLQRFFYITLPLLSPVLFFLLIIGIINSFQVFTVAVVMTNGGPMNATLFTVLYLYTLGFKLFRMGYAATVAWVLFLIIMTFTVIQFRLSKRWVFYEVSD
jgi:multiple sugar transport system permease protein